MQLAAAGRPLITDSLARNLPGRRAVFTPLQQAPLPFDEYVAAYRYWFPQREHEVGEWQATLHERHGAELAIQHYALHLGPKHEYQATWEVRDDLAKRYGESFGYRADQNPELAFARVAENVVKRG